ncbi:MAG: LPP20 family lipoprotein [Deltaproteobacteria bacterium]|nr:LPP20 family lipoprotein [Deltaproteobacteria bacterium]
MRRTTIGRYLMLALFITVAGCAPAKQEIPTEEIRARADRAFDDLQKEETGEKGISEDDSSAVRTLGGVREEEGSAVQVSKGARPDWVDGESMQYPSSSYLTGVGYDAERKSAEDKARAEIAKIFLSKVDSRTRTYQDYLQTTSTSKSGSEETFSIQEITDVSTEKVLSGVRIAHIYQQSSPEKLYYALAVLDRSQSATILSDRIRKLDADMEILLDMAEGEADVFKKIKYLKQSIGKHAMREAYDTELRIVSRSGRGISSPIHFTEIKSELDAILLRDFLIGVSVTGSRGAEVQDALVQGLNQEGFSISEDVYAANVHIRGEVKISPLERGTADWKYVRWRAHFDMVDRAGGSVFGSFTRTGREGHLNLQQAEDRAVRKIRDTLIMEIAGEVRRYIFSK